jgi:hypothetical protein
MAGTSIKKAGIDPTTSATTGTFSFWVKFHNARTDGNDYFLFSSYTDANSRMHIKIDGNGNLDINERMSSSTSINLITDAEYRDTSGWYHFVVAINTTQGTAADRVKVYVNGEQITSFSTETYPSQNEDIHCLQGNITHYLGCYGGNVNSANYCLDGSMSHLHFADGQQYAASVFGETDATTGIWKIKTEPTVTYGNNGWFIFKDNSSLTNQAGNSAGNFIVDTGTITTSKDNPSDTLATCNNLIQMDIGNGTFTATNSANKFTTNFTSKSIAGYSTLGAYKGKYYAECKYISGAAAIFGVVREDFQAGGSSFAISNADWGVEKGTTAYYGGSSNGSWHGDWSPNDILGCALDIDNNRVTFSKGGQWCDGSGNWDEANPTAWLTLTADKTYFFAAGDNSTSTNAAWEFNFGNGYFGTTAVSSAQNPSVGNTDAIFEYTVPTGFTALSTKGMNSF